MKNAIDFLRAIVRPAVTFGLVAAQVALAFAWLENKDAAEPAFAALAPFTMMALTFWFRERSA